MKCSICNNNKEFANEYSLKTHYTNQHGGFTLQQLKDSGIKPTQRDIARALAGNTSASEVTSQAPENEPKIGQGEEAKTRTRRSKVAVDDPKVAEAKERILRARCSRMASLPYTLLAKMIGDDAVRLTPEEETDLTESYVMVARAYGWEGASKIILWGDVMICHAAIVMSTERKKAIADAIEGMGQPAEVKEEVESLEPKE